MFLDIYMTIMNFSTMPREILYQSAVATNQFVLFAPLLEELNQLTDKLIFSILQYYAGQ